MDKPTRLVVDVTLIYAAVQTPNKTANAYTADMIALNKEEEAKLINAGLSPAKRESGEAVSHANLGFEGSVFRAKRKVLKADGSLKAPPIVTDSVGTPIKNLLGNGTKARVVLNVYDFNVAGKKGKAADLSRVQVIELVPFGDSLPPIVGGYVAGESDTKDSTNGVVQTGII